MYNGVLALLFGQAWLFRSGALLQYALVVLLMFHVMIVVFEERVLAAQFGAAYDEYRRAVPRWGFNVRPFEESPTGDPRE
jgi:protein-S-isoprenylcysteine O-methyltransferase Ste14